MGPEVSAIVGEGTRREGYEGDVCGGGGFGCEVEAREPVVAVLLVVGGDEVEGVSDDALPGDAVGD